MIFFYRELDDEIKLAIISSQKCYELKSAPPFLFGTAERFVFYLRNPCDLRLSAAFPPRITYALR